MSINAPNLTGFYVQNPCETDPTVLKQRAIVFMQAQMPAGWQLRPGSPQDLELSAISQIASEQAAIVNEQLDNAFRYLGLLVNCPPIDAIPAISSCTFTVQNTAGYTIPRGTVVGLVDGTGVLRGFDLSADLVIPNGASTGVGTVIAEDIGTVANGLSGAAQIVTAPGFVTAASMSVALGGIDAETDPVYLSRLAETLTTLKFSMVKAADAAILARTIPGVYRATGVDNLKPGPPYDGAAEASGQEKDLTIALTGIDGLSVGSTIRGTVQTFLTSLREQNFNVWAVDAQYTTIDVTAAVYSWPGWSTVDVQTRVVAALTNLLNPALYATDPTGNSARWANSPILRLDDVITAIRGVTGVRNVSPSPTFCVHGGTLATTDVTLGAGSSIPALPLAGTITVTVTATT